MQYGLARPDGRILIIDPTQGAELAQSWREGHDVLLPGEHLVTRDDATATWSSVDLDQ
jgi:hypothetical protein